MVELSVAAVVLGILGWDGWRRHIAREHDAVKIAEAAGLEAATAIEMSGSASGTLNKHAIALSALDGLEKRQSATAESVRMMKESKGGRKVGEHKSILGARRG